MIMNFFDFYYESNYVDFDYEIRKDLVELYFTIKKICHVDTFFCMLLNLKNKKELNRYHINFYLKYTKELY